MRSQRTCKQIDWSHSTKGPKLIQMATEIFRPEYVWGFPVVIREGQCVCTVTANNTKWFAGVHTVVMNSITPDIQQRVWFELDFRFDAYRVKGEERIDCLWYQQIPHLILCIEWTVVANVYAYSAKVTFYLCLKSGMVFVVTIYDHKICNAPKLILLALFLSLVYGLLTFCWRGGSNVEIFFNFRPIILKFAGSLHINKPKKSISDVFMYL